VHRILEKKAWTHCLPLKVLAQRTIETTVDWNCSHDGPMRSRFVGTELGTAEPELARLGLRGNRNWAIPSYHVANLIARFGGVTDGTIFESLPPKTGV
jgi:hypothetical protein